MLLLGACLLFCVKGVVCYSDEKLKMLRDEGYPSELYTVTTEDHYILGLHRIPSNKTNAKVVLAMHGLFASSANFLAFGRNYSLGYALSNAGYDVWLGNSRGTRSSRKHMHLNPNTSSTFWNYSFHEIGKYDLPAIIDFILIATNRTSLHYIGHSQGCAAFFVLLSLRPMYNQKIISMHAMAPAVILGHSNVTDKWVIRSLDQIERLAKSIHLFEVTLTMHPNLKKLLELYMITCQQNVFWQFLCIDIPSSHSPRLNKRMVTNFIKYTTDTVSAKQIIHFGQIIRSGKFRQFDYKKLNNKMYNSKKPPTYNLTNVRTDLQIIYGTSDTIVPQNDVEQLIHMFGDRVIDKVLVPGIYHSDFNFAMNANKLIYQRIIALINKYPN